MSVLKSDVVSLSSRLSSLCDIFNIVCPSRIVGWSLTRSISSLVKPSRCWALWILVLRSRVVSVLSCQSFSLVNERDVFSTQGTELRAIRIMLLPIDHALDAYAKVEGA